MKHWTFSFGNPMQAEFKVRAIQQGFEAIGLQRLSENVITEWSLEFSQLRDFDKEQVRDALLYHMGDKLFWFDCGLDGHIRERLFLGYGDGSRTDWYLPWRWIYAPSVIMEVGSTIVPGWTLTESTGMIRFSVAPAQDMPVHLKECKRRAKAFFVIGSDMVGKMTDNFKSFEIGSIRIREYMR